MNRLLLISMAFLVVLAMPIYAETNITDCQELNISSETYYLTTDITDTSDTCINITSDNIIFDCLDNTIDGNNTADTYGIYISNTTGGKNTTVRNCIISDFEDGIHLATTTYNVIYNIEISNVDKCGIDLYFNANNNIIYNITSDAKLQMLGSYHNIVYNSKWNNISSEYSVETGVYGTNNTLYNNIFNGTAIINPTQNLLNTTKQLGTRIYSSGTYIGGNYWTNPIGNGYSDTCTDANFDGFCDSAYNLGYGIDYLPLSDEYLNVETAPVTNKIYCIDNVTLKETESIIINDMIHNITYYENCENGCDNITFVCNPPIYIQTGVNITLIIMSIFGMVLIYIFARARI